jgi:serine/threonine-protein kinase HipA
MLDRYAADPAAELDQLVRAVAFTVLIGNADAHGKNLAFLHPTAATITLAPLYDTVPTLLWPKLRPDAAMQIGGRTLLTAITVADIAREARGWGVNETHALTTAADTVTAALRILEEEALPPAGAVAELIRRQAATMLAVPARGVG